MDTRERRQLRKLAREMSDTGDMKQFALAQGCIELLDYLDGLDGLLKKEEKTVNVKVTAAEPDLKPVTCWCRGEELLQRR